MQLYYQLRNQLEKNQLGYQLRIQLMYQLEDQLCDQLSNQLYYKLANQLGKANHEKR